MSTEIHHPHDGFFKASMSNLSVAKDLIQAHLAPELAQQIDWKSLRLTNKSYIDEQLSQFHSDMVYSCKLDGQDAYICLLIEQQTKPELLLPFRILEYNVRMMREHLKQGSQQLPLVANLVLYSGKQTPYPYSVDIYDCFEDPEKARELMFKPLQLIDLGQVSEEELSKHGSADMLELLLKQGRERTFLKWLEAHPSWVLSLLEREYGYSGLVYILAQERQHSGQEVVDTLISINPEKEEEIMTAAQTLRQEGRILGLQQGMQRKQEEMAGRLLLKGMDIPFIEDTTGLPAQEILKLSKKLGLSKD